MSTEHGRRETEDERADRNWNELLQELRVLQTGAQILTAFLMTLPFQARFSELDGQQRAVYVALLVAAAVMTALIMAPVAVHRGVFRRRIKEQTVAYGHMLVRLALLGIGLVVSLAVFFIVEFIATASLAWWLGGAVLLLTLLLLVGLPAFLRLRNRGRPGGE